MAEPNGIDMKLRAAFLLPALAVVVALTIAAAIAPDLIPLTTWIMPIVVFSALISLMLTERKKRRRTPE